MRLSRFTIIKSFPVFLCKKHSKRLKRSRNLNGVKLNPEGPLDLPECDSLLCHRLASKRFEYSTRIEVVSPK